MATHFTTPGGEDLVVLTRAEYERLVDRANVAAAHRVRADIAAGRDEMIPSDIVARLVAGENKIRVWRTYRGLSARTLAKATGLSAPYISEIESAEKEGSVAALKKIAEALRVDLDDIV